jgi:acyl homoserine lactone synthase
MDIVCGNRRSLGEATFRALTRYRHDVFVEQLGWPISSSDGLELDEFDGAETEYVAALEPGGRIGGCARLLPTTRSYLLQSVFPHLLNGTPLPCTPSVWELSRFAAVDLQADPAGDARLKALRSGQILLASVLRAASLGAKRLITVSPLGIERILRRMGAHAHRAGPPCMSAGQPVYACWIELDERTVSALSCYGPMPRDATSPPRFAPLALRPMTLSTTPPRRIMS